MPHKYLYYWYFQKTLTFNNVLLYCFLYKWFNNVCLYCNKLFWIEHGPMWQYLSIHYGHVATCIFRSTSTTWAPLGHEHASAPSLSPASRLLQKVADLLWVGYSWIELSKLATFLVCLKGKMGHGLQQQLRPKRDAMMFTAEKLFIAVVITCRKYFLIFPHYHLK